MGLYGFIMDNIGNGRSVMKTDYSDRTSNRDPFWVPPFMETTILYRWVVPETWVYRCVYRYYIAMSQWVWCGKHTWGVPEMRGSPIAGGFISWNISSYKWMMTGGTPIFRNLHIDVVQMGSSSMYSCANWVAASKRYPLCHPIANEAVFSLTQSPSETCWNHRSPRTLGRLDLLR